MDKNASHTGIGAGLPSHPLGSDGTRWNSSLFVELSSGWSRVGAAMEPYQWFLLGVMVAWTPGLLMLALVLRRRHDPFHERGPELADRHHRARAKDLIQVDRRVTGRALKS